MCANVISITGRGRAVLYLRQSTEREESISLENQETACRDYCERMGYTIVGVESDPGISGRSWAKRPGVQRTLEAVKEQRADVIVIWKWSRLARNRKDWAVAVDMVETSGGRIESATETVDVTTSTGRFARGVLAEFAAFESDRIGDTWKEAQARRFRLGLPHSGAPRFGYTYDKESGTFTPDPVTGPILAECYQRYIRGDSLWQICTYLASTGVPTSTRQDAGNWTPGRVSRLLSSSFAAGYVEYKGQTKKGVHEPLISEVDWETYQVLQALRKGTRSPASPQSIYHGLLICALCGHKLYQHNRRGHPSTFQCHGAKNGIHKGGSIREEYVDRELMDWMRREAAEQLNQRAKPGKAKPTSTEEPTLRRALGKAEGKLDTLTDRYVEGVIPRQSYERLRDDTEANIARLKMRLSEIRVQERREPVKIDPDVMENWEDFAPEWKRRILLELVGRIEVTPGRPRGRAEVVPKWSSEPFEPRLSGTD